MPIDLQLLTIERSVPDEGRGLPRLLIVDDDVVQQELLKRATGRAGYEISLAASCREAIGWISIGVLRLRDSRPGARGR